MLWHLVCSSWILHVSCNKRKVAPIAALLSSVLHSSLFSDESMHMIDGAPGPLKWVCTLSLSSIIFIYPDSPKTAILHSKVISSEGKN